MAEKPIRDALIQALDAYLRQDETAGDTDNNVYRRGQSAMSQALSAPPAAGAQQAVADDAAAWDFGMWLVKLMRLADAYYETSPPAKHRFRRELYDHARNARMHWRAHAALAATPAPEAAPSAKEGEALKCIGYTSDFDLGYPLAYPNIGAQNSTRSVPVYVKTADYEGALKGLTPAGGDK